MGKSFGEFFTSSGFRKIDAFILVILFALSFSAYFSFSQPNLITSPDELVLLLSANSLRERNSLNFSNPLNSESGTCVFIPNHFVFKSVDEIYPLVFIGSAFFYAFITSINENFFFWIIPFAGALMVLLVYLISLKLLNSRVFSILAAIVFFSSPIVVRVSTSSYNMALASAFFLAAVFFMLLLQKRAFIIFSGILFSISFFLRQDFLLFLPAMLLFIYLSAKKDWRRNFAHFLAPVVAFALLTLLLNLAYFNDAFFTPYGFSDSNPCIAQGSNGPKQPIEIVARYLFRFNELGPLELFGMIARHFVYFFQSSFAFPLAVFSVIGLLLFFKENKKFFFLVLIVFFIILAFYGNRESVGVFEETLNSSFLRYMLPFYAFLSVCFASLAKKAAGMFRQPIAKCFLAFLLLALVLTVQLDISYNHPRYGIDDVQNSLKKHLSAQRQAILESTEPDSAIFLSNNTDKLVYPERKNTINISTIDTLDANNTSKEIVEWLHEKGIKAYFVYYLYDSQEHKDLFSYLKGEFDLELKKSAEYKNFLVFEILEKQAFKKRA